MGGKRDDNPPLHQTPLQKLRYGDPREPDSMPGKMGVAEESLKFYNKNETDKIIAVSVIHPRSLDDSKSGKNPQNTLYIGEKAFDFLKSRKGPKKRQDGKKKKGKLFARRKWIKKQIAQREGRNKGYWQYRSRTPYLKDKKYKFFDSSEFIPKPIVNKKFDEMKLSELQVECKNRELSTTGNKRDLIKRLNSHDEDRPKRNQGKKPHGNAYIVRREAWHILANSRHVWRLINTPQLIEFDVGKKKKISLRLPNLEEEITELIMEEMIYSKRSFRDIPETRDILFNWLTKFKVDAEISEVIEALLCNPTELKPVIHALVKKHWRKLLSRWIELNAIFIHHHRSEKLDTISLNNPMIPENEVQMTEEEELTQFYKDLDYEVPYYEELANLTIYLIEPDEEE